MKPLALLLALLVQAPQNAPLVTIRATLRQLADHVDEHRPTYGATAGLTDVKHQLRDWVESRLAGQPESVDTRAFAETLHASVRDANLLCDDCDWNNLGYVDDIRVRRVEGFLVVITAAGVSCGYDESAYVYAWQNDQWRRIWEHEENTYTAQGYLPQSINDIQISSPDANRSRLLLMLGNQTMCGGAFKNVYTRAWAIDADNRFASVLDRAEKVNDEYPPILGRVRPGDVIVQFTAGGFLDGDTHAAYRHFKIDGGRAVLTDPVAGRPRDFVLEWLSAPWEESRTRADSPALEAAHAQLRRTDGVGDFPKPTLRCTAGPDLWQVTTHLYEGPERFFRVRWQAPFRFTMIGISETPYPDCTVSDERSETPPDVLNADLR